METSKVKRFLFAPKSASLKAALESQSNNVRQAVYISRYVTEDYMRIRIRNHSNTTQGICRAMAHRVAPITYYKLHAYGQGDDKCTEIVGTIRVEGKSFDEVVEVAKRIVEDVAAENKIYLKMKVSNILARDETPWVEIFCSKNRRLSVEQWKPQLDKIAHALGAEVILWDAEIREFESWDPERD